MTDIAELSVSIKADAKDLDATLRKIQADLDKADATGKKAGASIGSAFNAAAPGAQRAGAATLSFAQARARLLAQQGNLAGAERILQGALDGTTASTTRTINVERQLLTVQRQLSGEGGKSFGQMATQIDGLVGKAMALGSAFAVVQAGQAAYGFASAGAAAGAARQSFDNLAASAGTTGQALLGQLGAASKGTVSNLDAISAANRALLLMGSQSATQLPQLMAIAQASAVTLGTSTASVFDSLVTGISRGSTELIDNAGITMKAGDAYAAYAAKIGKSADSLTASEKQQALLNGVLQAGQTILNQTGGSANSAGVTFQQFEASVANLTSSLQQLAATGLAPAVGALGQFIAAGNEGIQQLQSIGTQSQAAYGQAAAGAASYSEYVQRAQVVTDALNTSWQTASAVQAPLTETQYQYVQALVASGTAAGTAVAQAQQYSGQLAQIASIAQAADPAVAGLADRMLAVAATSTENAAAMGDLVGQYGSWAISSTDLAAAVAQAEQAHTDAAAAAQEHAAAEAEAAAQASIGTATLDLSTLASNAQAQALRQAAAAAYERQAADASLEEQARAAAQALIAAGPAGASAAAQLANSSSQVDVLTAAFYRLQAAKAAALGGGGGALSGAMSGIKGAGASTAIERRFMQIGTSTGGGGRAKGGGGGGKSDAEKAAEKEQKQQNSLYSKLQDIQARAEDQMASAEERYQERILKIQQDYAAKQLEAQKKLAQDSAGNRADFYDRLTSSKLKPKDQQALSGQYEAAFAEAQKMAADGNAGMASDYLAFKEKQIGAEQDYQEKVAAAKEKGDKNEVKRLAAVKALRDKQMALEEQSIRDGGNSDKGKRDADLQAAAQERQDALTKAAVGAGDAVAEAQRKSGDAAKITNDQLQAQLDLLQKITGAGGITPAAAAQSATPTASTAPAPAASGGGGAALAVVDAAVVSAINNLADAMKRRPGYGVGG